jgi:hypothetical protein
MCRGLAWPGDGVVGPEQCGDTAQQGRSFVGRHSPERAFEQVEGEHVPVSLQQLETGR